MAAVAHAPSAAVVGAGAIGGWLADALHHAGWRVSMLARGSTLERLRVAGLQVESGGISRCSRPHSGSAMDLGQHDFVVLAVKAHALPELAPSLRPLLGPCTTVVSATNGLPWWFFQEFAGPLRDVELHSVDAGHVQGRIFPRGSALGAVVHASAEVLAPARIRVVAADRLLIGEPDGSNSARVAQLLAGLRAGGINAHAATRIRHEVWAKLWGNMNMNPLSALTRSGTGTMLDDDDVRALCIHMMEEMQRCGERLGLGADISAEQRIGITRRLGNFKTSMLADLESGRSLELGPQLGAIVEIAARLDIPAPFCRAVLGLARLIDPREE
jgi:2-dehydropantoate 2-reductase